MRASRSGFGGVSFVIIDPTNIVAQKIASGVFVTFLLCLFNEIVGSEGGWPDNMQPSGVVLRDQSGVHTDLPV